MSRPNLIAKESTKESNRSEASSYIGSILVCRKGGERVVAKKKAEKSTENAGKEYPGTKNLVPVRTKEEAKERGRNGGLKSAEVRRQKRTMRDMSKCIMETTVS